MKNEQNPDGTSTVDVTLTIQKVSEILADETRPYEERAEEAYNTYYQTYEQANETGCEREEYMKLLRSASEFMYNHQAFEVMLSLEEELLEYQKEELGENHIAVASRYHNIGLAHKKLGNYDQAEEHFQRGLEIKMSTLEEDDERILYDYYDIADLYMVKQEYDKALEYYEMLYEKTESRYGHNHMAVAEICDKLSDVHSRLGNTDESWKYTNWSMEISMSLNDENLNFDMNQFDDDDPALEQMEAELQQKIEELGEDHIEVGNYYNEIGTYCDENFEWEKALEYHEKALQIRLAAYGENHLDVAESYFKAAKILEIYDTTDKDKEYLEKCLQIRLRILGENHPDIVSTLRELSHVENDWQQSAEYLKKALQICTVIYDENNSELFAIHRNLATAYNMMEMNEDALEHYLKALKIGQETFEDDEVLYESIGDIYMRLENPQTALEYFLTSKEKAESLTANPLNLGIYNKIGLTYQSLNEFDNALKYHQIAIRKSTEQYGETSIETINGLIYTGLVYENLGNTAEAIKYYEKGIQQLPDTDPDKEGMMEHLESLKQ